MNTFTTCNNIRHAILTRAAEVFTYTKWGEDFALNQIKEIPVKLNDASWFEAIRVDELTKAEMEQLGFRQWNEETGVMLIPLWLRPFLNSYTKVTSICGEVKTVGECEDNDHRTGLMSYGVVPKA